jgi:hypothetical protein
MTAPEDYLPSHLVSDAGYWRVIAQELRLLAATPNYPHRVTTELEAADADWRATLLDLAFEDVSAFLRLAEARSAGIGLDAALMYAFPDM